MKIEPSRSVVALVGNPNSGKTTIFNQLTGGRQRVGNWPGVTVERVDGILSGHEGNLRVVDLPGIYSLFAGTEDEQVARSFLLGHEADLVVNVVSAEHLERHLYLTTQLIELGLPMVVVVTMMDRATDRGIQIDLDHLSHHLGVPVLGVNGLDTEQTRGLRSQLVRQAIEPVASPVEIAYPATIERVVASWEGRLAGLASDLGLTTRWMGIKLLEGDQAVRDVVVANNVMRAEDLELTVRELASREGEDLDIVLADARFGFIHGVANDVARRALSKQSVTERVDAVVMNPVLGIPIFLTVMYAVFWLTMAVGGAFIDFFDAVAGVLLIDGSRAALSLIGAPSWMVLAGASIATGLQTVATFVPIILMMFLLLSLLESSGYMARAAFVMDRSMRWLGLSGKAFVPLMVGFGCTVPAITATRTLESRKDRMMTVFLAPLMSCGARLPVYALFAAAFFPSRAGLVVFSLYGIGIVMAVLTGLLLKRTLFPGEGSHMVMELPPYHLPHLGSTVRYTWHRLQGFVTGAGKTIVLAISILTILNTVTTRGTIAEEGASDAILPTLARGVTPLFEPLGVDPDNWPGTVGLVTGIFAKEAIVGTLNALYAGLEDGQTRGDPGTDERNQAGYGATLVTEVTGAAEALWTTLRSPGTGFGDAGEARSADISRLRGWFTPAAAYSYLLFVLIYMPCIAAFAAALREIGPKYGWLLGLYLTVAAWSVSTAVYQVAEGGSVAMISASVAAMAAVVLLFAVVGKRSRRQRPEMVLQEL